MARATAPRPSGAGGDRFAAAFDAVSALPALAEARRRAVRACEREHVSTTEIAEAIEDDTALAVAVMRAANNGTGPRGRAAGVAEAIAELSGQGVLAIAGGIATYDALEQPSASSRRYERFRRHAVAVRTAAVRVGELAGAPHTDELAISALLHDVGRLVLAELHGEAGDAGPHLATPGERARAERRELGIDHALVGAVLIRRWGLPQTIATAVERHHAASAEGHAAAIRLGDMIAHHAAGEMVSAGELQDAATGLGIGDAELRSLLYEFPHGGERRRRASEPCPLSVREVEALKGLAEGKVYKQIAQELSLSVSTIRTHLHNVYRKTGAVDRAQAVLIARDHGWL